MSSKRLRWCAAIITTAALAMTGPMTAQAAGPTPTPTPTPAVSTTSPTPAPATSTTSPTPTPAPSTSTTTKPTQPAKPVFKTSLRYATTDVTVRGAASKTSKNLGLLKRGQYVGTRDSGNGTATRSGWTAVKFQGTAGWIDARYLSTTKPKPAPAPKPVFKKYLVYATTTVPVRPKPSLASRGFATMKRGDRVAAVGIAQRGFTPVSFKGRTAWVQTSYLSRTKPVANPQRLDNRCLSGLVICISKNNRKLRLVSNGRILLTLDARFGSEFNPTREGTFKIYYKDRNHVSGLYGSKMPFSMFFSGGQAVHYSSDFHNRGWAGHSHGCVNIRDWNGITYLWNHAPVGTKVVVYR